MDIHLYFMCFRFEALVASHLDPERFGRYMAVGSEKHTRGAVMFFEIDPHLKSRYFKLDDIQERCAPHEDGSPKRSKYISVYRVLEHLPLESFGKLHMVARDGRTLGLDAAPGDDVLKEPGTHLYQELCPVPPMVVSSLSPGDFGHFMTDPSNPVHVPCIFYADLIIDREPSGELAGYLPYSDPLHVADCIKQLEQEAVGGKKSKTVNRVPDLSGFYRTVRRGFFLADQTGQRYYPFPNREKLEIEYRQWWRSASLG